MKSVKMLVNDVTAGEVVRAYSSPILEIIQDKLEEFVFNEVTHNVCEEVWFQDEISEKFN